MVKTAKRLLIISGLTIATITPLYLLMKTPGYQYTIDTVDKAPPIRNPLTGETVPFVDLLRRDAELEQARESLAMKNGVSVRKKPVSRGC